MQVIYSTKYLVSPVTTGDFSGGSRIHLAMRHNHDNTVDILLRNAVRTIQNQVIHGTGRNSESMTTGDFNIYDNGDTTVMVMEHFRVKRRVEQGILYLV
ncbi:unnamed protein product [Didymodactylos carnosus]|uniref:Uncharacterized protein n=2 Tax=Didymodactylos carnosus TaxID=1234261 RepID=A0A815A6W4_9BILA|nr:unnamed protein product [Didymodactylos carnosus]CAF4027488.1 unnamed protein product [Didymodactylos carnosus]